MVTADQATKAVKRSTGAGAGRMRPELRTFQPATRTIGIPSTTETTIEAVPLLPRRVATTTSAAMPTAKSASIARISQPDPVSRRGVSRPVWIT